MLHRELEVLASALELPPLYQTPSCNTRSAGPWHKAYPKQHGATTHIPIHLTCQSNNCRNSYHAMAMQCCSWGLRLTRADSPQTNRQSYHMRTCPCVQAAKVIARRLSRHRELSAAPVHRLGLLVLRRWMPRQTKFDRRRTIYYQGENASLCYLLASFRFVV